MKEVLTVEALASVTGVAAFVYLVLALFVKPVIQRKSEEWRKKNAGIVLNFFTIGIAQAGIVLAGIYLKASAFGDWVNLVLVGLCAAGVSTGVYEVKKNFGKATTT